MNVHMHRQTWAARQASIAAACAAFGIRNEVDPVEELRQRQRRLVGRSEALLNRADEAGREITADERRQIQTNTAEVERLATEIDDANMLADYGPGSRATDRHTPANSAEPLAAGAPPRLATSHLAVGGQLTMPAQPASARWSDLFPRARTQDAYAGRFSCLGDFGLAVFNGNDPRLQRPQAAAMGESTGAGGGFLVPPQFLADIFDTALAMEVVRPRANVLPMFSKELTVGLFDHQDGTDGKSAGLQLKWAGENTQLDEQTGVTRDLTLNARKGSIYVKVSNELASDAMTFDRQLRTAMIGAVSSGLDYAFLQGTGAGQPLGVINGPATITVSKEGGQAANTLMLQNLAKMLARLSPRSYARSVWLVHMTLLPLLYQMAVVIKNVAGSENVGGGSAAVTIDGQGNLRIFGRPVIVTDACAALSSKGDIVLADWAAYVIGLRMDATIVRDSSVHFNHDQVAFRMILRLDGQPMNSTPKKLRDGTNTVAPFVTLEAR